MGNPEKTTLLAVAHPDDETLFAGGTMLLHTEWDVHVVTLCRGDDADRRPRFEEAITRLGVNTSSMGDADDGPEQIPLENAVVQGALEALLSRNQFDLVITHALNGEYTRHLRHEEVSRAVVALWEAGRLNCKQLWMFAYADSGRGSCPIALPDAHFIVPLPATILEAKESLITSTYNFTPTSWEARCMPTREAFWCFDDPRDVSDWADSRRIESLPAETHNGGHLV